MSFIVKIFQQLTTEELYRILQQRTNVFVVEQNCPYPEVDGKDLQALHVFQQVDGEITAYLRILPAGVSYEEASIGRVLVNEKYRGQGLARHIFSFALQIVEQQLQEKVVKIQAQHYLQQFYGSFGFEVVSDVYLEDGIPHIDMVLKK